MNPQQLAQQAIERHRQGDAKEAERLCQRILAMAPADFTANYLLGVICFQQARGGEALPLLERAVNINPHAAGPLIYYGLLLQMHRRFEEALSCFERVLVAEPGNVEALVNRGNVLCNLSRFAQALPSYDKALALRPNFELALYNRGNALRGLGRLTDALASFDAGLRVKPDYIDVWVNRGGTLRDLKMPEAALASFDRALALMPGNASALYNRGTVLYELKRFAEALDAFDQALLIVPGFATALNNRAVVLHNLNRFPEALADYDRALAIEPDNAELLNNRGNTLREMKRWDDALVSLDRSLGIRPANGEALNNRGNVLRGLKRFDEALTSFDQALALAPDSAVFLCNRGLAFRDLKQFTAALADFDRALSLAPDDVPALCNRGLTLCDLQRFAEALASYDRALAVKPHFPEAGIGRADTLREMGSFAQALESYDRALAIAPDNVSALNDRGSVLQKLNRPAEALESYNRALAIDPNCVEALYNRGNFLYLKLRRFEEAQRDLERVALIDPSYNYLPGDLLHLRMHAGDWRDIEQQCADIDAGVRDAKCVVRPFVYQAISQSPADLQAASVIYARQRFPAAAPMTGKRRERKKIRIGYVSGEFREQATSLLAAGLFEQHDKSKFEIVAFDAGWNDGSAMRARLEAAFDKFVDLSNLPDAAAAEKVRAEDIDILVNLTGYFGGEPMGAFAHRSAPVQVNFLGFPATLGAPYIDYILADRIVIPPEEQEFYTEKVVYLPDTYQVNDSKRAIADTVPSRAQAGLPDERFVFCNFNNAYKLTPGMFAVWLDILRQTGDSVLWLLESNKTFAGNLKREAERQGVAPERLVFARPVQPADHLARMKLADLFLDGLPYNAHTTASDSLWAGLPLLTCRGKTFPGRVAASLLHAAGMPELVTDNLKDYQALALRLAGDPVLLASLRQKLARNRLSTPLFDTDRFRQHIESAYAAMWQSFQRGEKPRSFDVEPVRRFP